jgi:hypothetical protein
LAALIIGLSFLCFVFLVSMKFGFSAFSPYSIVANFIFYSISTILIFLLSYLGLLWKYKPESPIKFTFDQPHAKLQLRRILKSAPILVILSAVLPTFSAMKSQIGSIFPYSWDTVFLNADLYIHGTDPWRILQPILGFPFATWTIGWFYHLWVLLLYVGTPLLCIYFRTHPVFRQFICSYLLCWALIGSVFANIFASVGPCFLEEFTGNPHYRPLMDYLHGVDRQYPLMFLDVQQSLLGWQRDGDTNLGRGISAMPSMHVSIALLFALTISRISRLWGYAFWAFFGIIFIGSIHTGYHYAVDGYTSILMTLSIWWLAGRFFGRGSRAGPINAEPLVVHTAN